MNTQLSETNLPWYRHRWPWILMAGPFIVVVAGLVTAYLAATGSDGLVDDDYYKQGLAVNKVSARDQQALSLGLEADVMQSADGAQIRVLLRGGPAFVAPDALNLRIIHPTRGGTDQTLLLRADGAGSYTASLSKPLSGRWHIAMDDEAGLWRLTGNWNIEHDAVLRLPGKSAPQPRSSTDANLKINDKGR